MFPDSLDFTWVGEVCQATPAVGEVTKIRFLQQELFWMSQPACR